MEWLWPLLVSKFLSGVSEIGGGDYRMTLGRCVVEKLWSGLVVWSGLGQGQALVVLINSTAVAYT